MQAQGSPDTESWDGSIAVSSIVLNATLVTLWVELRIFFKQGTVQDRPAKPPQGGVAYPC